MEIMWCHVDWPSSSSFSLPSACSIMPKNLLNSVSNSQWIDWHSLDGAVLCSNSIGSICCIRQIAPVELELRGTDKGEFLGEGFPCGGARLPGISFTYHLHSFYAAKIST